VKIFVTGATGFVGKVFTENLLSEPCKVEACVRQTCVALALLLSICS
jgi:nucleoside-diphosphate-sugar epimerase